MPPLEPEVVEDAHAPKLIEPDTYTYLSDVLAKCGKTRASVYLYALNIIVFVVFVLVVSAVLYMCYKRKPTAEQQRQKELADHAYILSKIRQYKQERDHIVSRATITGLPILDNRPL